MFKHLILFLALVMVAAAEPISLMPDIAKKILPESDSFYVTCNTDGTNVQRVMWTGPEGSQITNYDERIHIEDGKANDHRSVQLHFRNTSRKDIGIYTCSAHVDGNDVHKSFELDVFKLPDFSLTPKKQFLEEKKDSILKCEVEAIPKPLVNWRKDNKPLLQQPDKYAISDVNKDYLVVKNVSLNDTGIYLCEVKQNSGDNIVYRFVTIQASVHHEPIKNDSQNNVRSVGYLSGVVNLTCEAVAEPQANFTWLKDDVNVTESADVKIFYDNDKSVLQLTVTDKSTFGDYICIAENHLGKLERVIPLIEGHKPAVPELKVVKTGSNALKIKLNAENHPKEPIRGYKVEFKAAGDEWIAAKHKVFESGKDTYTLDGLQNNKMYSLRAFSRSDAGHSDPSKPTVIKTTVANGIHSSGKVSEVSHAMLLGFIAFFLTFNEAYQEFLLRPF